MDYISSTLDRVLSSPHNTTAQMGNFVACLTRSEFNFIIEIHYWMQNKQQYTVGKWDAAKKLLLLRDVEMLRGKKKIQVAQMLKAIHSLGHEVRHIKLCQGESMRDVTRLFEM